LLLHSMPSPPLKRTNQGFIVQEAGDASADRALSKTLSNDFKRAERLALPITLLIMLLAFGALVAAGLPVLLAFSGVTAAVGISSLFSHLLPAADATMSVILLVGMAVGVDYSLFYLKREREERAAGHDPHTAPLRTAATSGHAVLISGATVLVAVSGLLLSDDPAFKSIGLGAMFVVAFAMVGSLTVLPAAAAIVMVAVFSIFATLSQLDLKQAGFGLAVAILIDPPWRAQLVRASPARMDPAAADAYARTNSGVNRPVAEPRLNGLPDSASIEGRTGAATVSNTRRRRGRVP
jgi:uncharacterized membrane protein YdfJ with MMPL/SSD domain